MKHDLICCEYDFEPLGLPEIVSESIINEFMNTLTFTYDKSEKCMVAKIYNSDLTSLKDIIESKL